MSETLWCSQGGPSKLALDVCPGSPISGNIDGDQYSRHRGGLQACASMRRCDFGYRSMIFDVVKGYRPGASRLNRHSTAAVLTCGPVFQPRPATGNLFAAPSVVPVPNLYLVVPRRRRLSATPPALGLREDVSGVSAVAVTNRRSSILESRPSRPMSKVQRSSSFLLGAGPNLLQRRSPAILPSSTSHQWNLSSYDGPGHAATSNKGAFLVDRKGGIAWSIIIREISLRACPSTSQYVQTASGQLDGCSWRPEGAAVAGPPPPALDGGIS